MSDHPAPPRFEAPPPAIPGLELLEPIGRGGFSTVWRARQAMIDRIVAVKLLSLDMRDPADQRRFQRECSAAGRLTSHPHVVQVYEVGFVDARPYLVMEHFAGGSAADLLARRGPLPLAEALDVGAKIAGALHAAHTLGILHRDVKPENILLDGAGRPALADFGISTVGFNQSLSSIKDTFTPLHAAPETVEGRAPSPAADVYALASTVWTLLAGFAPFQRSDDSSVAAILLRILHEPPPPLPVPAPPALGALLDRSLAKRPEDRPASAAELGAALAEIAAAAGQPGRTTPTAGPAATTILAGGGPFAAMGTTGRLPSGPAPATAAPPAWPRWLLPAAVVVALLSALAGLALGAALA